MPQVETENKMVSLINPRTKHFFALYEPDTSDNQSIERKKAKLKRQYNYMAHEKRDHIVTSFHVYRKLGEQLDKYVHNTGKSKKQVMNDALALYLSNNI